MKEQITTDLSFQKLVDYTISEQYESSSHQVAEKNSGCKILRMNNRQGEEI